MESEAEADDRGWAFADRTRKRRVNNLWVDLVALLHLLLSLLPGPLRTFAWRHLLGTCGHRVFFDRKVYVKYPWLIHMGDDIAVNRGVEFYPDLGSHSGITIGSDAYLAPHARFHASGHDLEDLTRHVGGPIIVGTGCWIGAGALVLPGITIGDDVVIGAGSVVTDDIPDGSIAVGAPAKVIRTRGAPLDP